MADFPSLPFLDDAVSKELIPPETRTSWSVSHKRTVDSWGSAFQRRWTINVRALGTEAGTLIAHYLSMVGTSGRFTFTDPQGETGPETGGKWMCCYENPTLKLELRQGMSDFWPATVSILQVL